MITLSLIGDVAIVAAVLAMIFGAMFWTMYDMRRAEQEEREAREERTRRFLRRGSKKRLRPWQ